MSFQLTPEAALKAWGKGKPGPVPDSLAGVRFDRVSPIRAAIQSGEYDGSATRLASAVASLKDAIFHPDLAEIERAEFDRQAEEPERWDGMS